MISKNRHSYDYTKAALVASCICEKENLLENMQLARREALTCLEAGGLSSSESCEVLDCVEDFLEFVSSKPVASASPPPSTSHRHMTFSQLLKVYGESSLILWKCQTHYQEKAMQYLLHNPDSIMLDKETAEDGWALSMGLLFASGVNCKLAVCLVPQFLEWRISVYDGLENVEIL
jgi:hypothetical protein